MYLYIIWACMYMWTVLSLRLWILLKSQFFDSGSVYVYSVKQKRSPYWKKNWGRHCIVYIMEMYVCIKFFLCNNNNSNISKEISMLNIAKIQKCLYFQYYIVKDILQDNVMPNILHLPTKYLLHTHTHTHQYNKWFLKKCRLEHTHIHSLFPK